MSLSHRLMSLATYVGRNRHISLPIYVDLRPIQITTPTYVGVVICVTLCSLKSSHRHRSVAQATYVGGTDLCRPRTNIGRCTDIDRYAGDIGLCHRHKSPGTSTYVGVVICVTLCSL